MSLAREVLAGSYALVDAMLKKERPAAGVPLTQPKEKEHDWPYGEPAWARKYAGPEKPLGEES